MTRQKAVLIDFYSDMANIELPWEVDGLMTPEQSVLAMIPVIQSKGIQHSGTFWTWENKARIPFLLAVAS